MNGQNPLLPYPVAYACSAVVFVLLVLLGIFGLAYLSPLAVGASILGVIGTGLLPLLVLTPRMRAQQFMLAATGRLPRDLGRPPA